MTEQQLKEKFTEFLLTKGYTTDSFLHHPSFQDNITRVHSKGFIVMDLAIIDKQINEILAVVDFQMALSAGPGSPGHEQLIRVFNAIKHDTQNEFIRYFIVIPIAETDFEINILTGENFIYKIPKTDFPSLKDLIQRRDIQIAADKKITVREKLKVIQDAKKKTVATLTITVASLILGIIVALMSSYFLDKKEYRMGNGEVTLVKMDSMRNEILKLQKLINQSPIDSLRPDTVKNGSESISAAVEQRIKSLERAIIETPEKTLSLINVNNDISELKSDIAHIRELDTARIEFINQKINDANSMIIGLYVAIFSIVIGYLVTNLKKT